MIGRINLQIIKKKKKIIVTGIILFCLVSLIVFLCVKNINKSNEQSSNSNNFKIVTSFYPMYIIAENEWNINKAFKEIAITITNIVVIVINV